MKYRWLGFVFLFILCFSLAGCFGGNGGLPKEIIYRDWEGAMPQSVLDAFTKETGIKVIYQPYDTQETVLKEIHEGQVFDVVVLENALIPSAVNENLLSEVHLRHLSNFKNISPNFRDLAYDPKNAHSVPYSWGATGLVVRSDLTSQPVTRWADMWNPDYTGKVITWNSPRYMIGVALKALGYSANSEDPEELEAAKQKLLELSRHAKQVNWEVAVATPYLLSGEAVVAIGQVDDLMAGQEQNPNIIYVMPEEGPLMWGDNWTIPSNSPNHEAAEMLINFFLRPEISAEVINTTYYWLPNDAAIPLVEPELRENKAILPDTASLKSAEILMGLSPEGEKLHQQVWEEVQAAWK